MRIAIALVLVAATASPLLASDRPRILKSAAKLAAETRLEIQVQRTEPVRRRRPARPALPWIIGVAVVGGLVTVLVLSSDVPDTLYQGDPEPPRQRPF